MQDTRTRSPSSTVVTAPPVSTIVPTASWPRIVPGSTSGTSPLRMWRSVPQIVAESIRTIASVSAISSGSGTVSQERCPGPWKTSAFMVLPPSRLVEARLARHVGPRPVLQLLPETEEELDERRVRHQLGVQVREQALLVPERALVA